MVHTIRKLEAETFFQTLSDVKNKALVYTLTDTIACTGGAPVDTLA